MDLVRYGKGNEIGLLVFFFLSLVLSFPSSVLNHSLLLGSTLFPFVLFLIE